MAGEKWIEDALGEASKAADIMGEVRMAEALCGTSIPPPPAEFPMICDACGNRWRLLLPGPDLAKRFHCPHCGGRKTGKVDA